MAVVHNNSLQDYLQTMSDIAKNMQKTDDRSHRINESRELKLSETMQSIHSTDRQKTTT